MNKFIGVGRLTKDVVLSYSKNDSTTAIARYTIAIPRMKKEESDFLSCIAFGKNGEFASKYFKKGMRVAIVGRLQQGSFTNKEGEKIHTLDIIVEEQEFADGKKNENMAESTESHLVEDSNGSDELPFT